MSSRRGLLPSSRPPHSKTSRVVEEPKGVKGWPQYFLLGHFLTAVDYLRLNRLRAIVMQRFDKMMQAVDASMFVTIGVRAAIILMTDGIGTAI